MSLEVSATSGTPAGTARLGAPLGAVDRVVGREVHVRRPLGVLDLRGLRDAGRSWSLSLLGRDVHLAPRSLASFTAFCGPDAGEQVVGGASGRQEVHRHHGELQRRAALEEQHLVVVRRCRPGRGSACSASSRILSNTLPRWLCSMMPMPLPATFQMSCCAFLQHRLGQDGGAGAEVEDAVAHGLTPPVDLASARR